MQLVLVCLLPLLACRGGEAAPCSGEPGQATDACLAAELGRRSAAELDAVFSLAGRIRDPLVRGAAVSAWVSRHPADVGPARGEQLCGLLVEPDRKLCQRRLSSPHLQR